MDGVNWDQLFSSDQLVLGSKFGPQEIVLSMVITFLIAMFIYYVYKFTYSGVLYSKSFNITLVMTALIVNVIMIGISGNIVLSLGMLGALSIVRFRTAVKDPRDTAFIFWAITIGIINGVAFYDLAVISTLFIALILIVLSKMSVLEPPYVVVMAHKGTDNTEIAKVLSKHCKQVKMRSDAVRGDEHEQIAEVKLRGDVSKGLLEDLRNLKGMAKCILLSSTGELAD